MENNADVVVIGAGHRGLRHRVEIGDQRSESPLIERRPVNRAPRRHRLPSPRFHPVGSRQDDRRFTSPNLSPAAQSLLHRSDPLLGPTFVIPGR
jgi:hypothetical protein